MRAGVCCLLVSGLVLPSPAQCAGGGSYRGAKSIL